MKRQRGRRIPDQSRVADAFASLEAAIQEVEVVARHGYAHYGRGAVLRAVYQDPSVKPAILYISADSPGAALWTGTNADIAEAVARYNPNTHYVVIEGIVDFDTGALQSAEVFVISYPPPPTLTA